jgi:hypothetical protein
MPNISMCATGCPIAAECYRSPQSGTQGSHWQSWSAFHFSTTDEGDVVCEHFMPVWERAPTPSRQESKGGERG